MIQEKILYFIAILVLVNPEILRGSKPIINRTQLVNAVNNSTKINLTKTKISEIPKSINYTYRANISIQPPNFIVIGSNEEDPSYLNNIGIFSPKQQQRSVQTDPLKDQITSLFLPNANLNYYKFVAIIDTTNSNNEISGIMKTNTSTNRMISSTQKTNITNPLIDPSFYVASTSNLTIKKRN